MARRDDTPLVGPDVPDQRRIRPTAPVRDPDEFLAFLGHLHVLTPPRKTPAQPPTTGDHFLL